LAPDVGGGYMSDDLSMVAIAKANKNSADLADNTKQINKGIATNNISNGGGYERKPVACITFDDGYMTDYTMLKSVMDEFGVVGTAFINTRPNEYSQEKLTATEIKQMANDGWEFGSHTASHIALYELTLNKDISIGDTTIEIINAGTGPMFKAYPTGTKFRVKNSANTIFKIVTAIGYSLTSGVLTLQLDTPTDFAIVKPGTIYLHEESVLEEIMEPKTFLQSIGVSCNGLAYPWGSVTDTAKKVIQSNFNYARLALSSNAGTNGGTYDGDDYKFNQFKLNCSEIPSLTDADMDALISKIITDKGMLVVLGHTSGWGTLEPKLRTLLTKLQTAKIDIMTISDALLYQGNISNFGDFNILKSGNLSEGVSILPRKSVNVTSGIYDFPVGISYMRVLSADTAGFPTTAGIAMTVRPIRTGTASWYSFQIWYEMDSVSKKNRIYYRIPTTAFLWTDWEKLNNDMTIDVANTHGYASLYTDFKPNKILFEAITGGDLIGFPESGKGLLETITANPSNGYYKQLYYLLNKNKIYLRGITDAGVTIPWQRILIGDVYTSVNLGSQTVPANGYIDVVVPGITVKSSDAVSANAYNLNANINYNTFVLSSAIYIRLINMSASPITYTPIFTISVIPS
jgi:peptidoglycan/xylan/chitin deacetylase (PgdA/CDA1 family)